MTQPVKSAKPKRPQQVYTLLVELGRAPEDGLPKGATGAAMLCFASGVDEEEAVRETVVVLKQAGVAPLDITGYGTLEERLAQGHEIEADERALMDRALAENAVIVAQVTPFFDDESGSAEGFAEPATAPRAAASPKRQPAAGKGAKPQAAGKPSGKPPRRG